MNYRNEARNALTRAKHELNGRNDHRLRYAALELRMALEGIIYDRASLYKEELSSEQIGTWQPKQVLDLLIEIDPDADKSTHLSFGLEEEYGKPAKNMTSYGEERVLRLGEIKKYYARLGSYLHTPTAYQLAKGKGATPDKMRNRCDGVIKILEQVLASPIWNVDFKETATIHCENCNAKIVRRVPSISESRTVRCLECSATYCLTSVDEKQVKWKPLSTEVKCANKSCNSSTKLWEKEIEVGQYWNCQDCVVKNQIVLAVTCYAEPNLGSPKPKN